MVIRGLFGLEIFIKGLFWGDFACCSWVYCDDYGVDYGELNF